MWADYGVCLSPPRTIYLLLGGDVSVDVKAISDFISTVGFPVAVVIWLFYYQKTVLDEFREQMTENTKVMQSLVNEIQEHFHKE